MSDDGLSAGYATLSWAEAAGTSFELEINREDGWRRVYRGGDRATTLSGLADGAYRLRLAIDGRLPVPGDEITLEVRHHALGEALAFFWAGAMIFLILLVLLITGSRTATDFTGRSTP